MGRVWLFDIQGWITLVIGGLLALITLFSSYSHVSIPFIGTVELNQQIGVLQLKIEDEQRSIAHEQRMGQLKSEIAQLNELNSKLDALLCSSSTSSTPPLSTPDNSEA